MDFENLVRSGALRELDRQFARFICRLAGSDSRELALAAALVSQRTGEGHVCADLHAEAQAPLFAPPQGQANGEPAPPAAAWIEALGRFPVVGAGEPPTPLVLDAAGRLYLHRYWDYERQLAADLLARHQSEQAAAAPKTIRQGLERLFPPTAVTPDWQKVAAGAAALRRLTIISGGPGTGKTTTVIRLLALLLELQPKADLRIALAAPTGKAAVRLQESIAQNKADLKATPAIRERIPERVSTLHRLLGARPDSVFFRHHRDNPLPLDVLVLDEASMVDMALMTKLCWALPAEARLILLGDKDQLASVEAGAVLGDLCAGGEGFSAGFRQQLEAVTGEPLASADATAAGPLADAVVVLRHSYRFAGESGIGRLAAAVNAGDAPGAAAILRQPQADLEWIPGQRPAAEIAAEAYADYLQAMAQGADPRTVFDRFEAFRCLCALRHGPSGVSGINRTVEQRLRARGLVRGDGLWFAGRPVMIGANDYNLRLFNGDLGLILPDPEAPERLLAWFPDPRAAGRMRGILPARLPRHETAFAITVHKSQGSEFDQVLLALPERPSPVLSRELLYTAITRAAKRFLLQGPEEIVADMIHSRTVRNSGLREKFEV